MRNDWCNLMPVVKYCATHWLCICPMWRFLVSIIANKSVSTEHVSSALTQKELMHLSRLIFKRSQSDCLILMQSFLTLVWI